jgi:hypothetical protein
LFFSCVARFLGVNSFLKVFHASAYMLAAHYLLSMRKNYILSFPLSGLSAIMRLLWASAAQYLRLITANDSGF